MKIFIIISLFVSTIIANAQVVNIENKRFYNDSSSFVGKVKVNLTGFRNITEILSFGNSVNLQLRKSNSKFMLIGDINYLSADKVHVDNNAFVHFRYNYIYINNQTLEVFMQAQYNEILKITQRQIIGSGLRFNVYKSETNQVFYGLGGFYEHEYDKPDKLTWNDYRGNTYITYNYQHSPDIEFANTFYYQPNVTAISDMRIFNEFAMIIDLSKKFGFETGLFILYDNKHGVGIPDVIYKYETKLTLNL